MNLNDNLPTVREILDKNRLHDICKSMPIKCIYKITSPTNKVYIGCTVNFYNRIHSYNKDLKQDKLGQPKLYNSFKKYGIINHTFEIVKTVEIVEELNALEREYIKMYNSVLEGLNCTDGGRDTYNHSDETKEKISKINKGRKLSALTISRLSESHKGKPSNRKGVTLSEETRKRISDTKKSQNKKLTEEHKAAISEGNKSKSISEETRDKINKIHKELYKIRPGEHFLGKCKIILQFTIKGEFIKETTTTNLKLEGLPHSAILKCCRGESKTSCGFIWVFKDKMAIFPEFE